MAIITIDPKEDVAGIATVAGASSYRYDNGQLICDDITQGALDAALVTYNPANHAISQAMAAARELREAEWEIARDGFNDAFDRGLPTQAWQDYRVALRDMTKNPLWSTDPIAVVDAIIATRPT